MNPLRVVVASDAVGPLDTWQAGVAIARGWAEHGQVAVVPLADAGPPLAGALAALLGGQVQVGEPGWWLRAGDTLAIGPNAAPVADPGWDPAATTTGFGRWVDECLGTGPAPARLILDLTAVTALDGGAGLLAALGATASGELTAGLAGLAEVGEVELAGLRQRLAGTEVIGVIPAEQTDLVLLGLPGAVSRRGYGVRLDPAELLAAEAAMSGWLGSLAVTDRPGVGAAGGAAAAVWALGGRVLRGAGLCAELAGLAGTVHRADVVVTGCTSFDIGNRGGQLVRFVAETADAAERPCLVFAPAVSLSRREMRTFGVEAAYECGPGELPDALTAAAVRVAQGWTAAAGRGVD